LNFHQKEDGFDFQLYMNSSRRNQKLFQWDYKNITKGKGVPEQLV
jgi:hypothetical protein